MIAEVIVDIPSSNTDKIFDYIAIDNVQIGSRVSVPFSGRKLEGFVINLKASSDLSGDKLKAVLELLDAAPALTAEMIELMRYMVFKYHIRMIDALRLFVPAQMRGGRIKELTKKKVSLIEGFDIDGYIKNFKTTKAQTDLLYALKTAPMLQTDLNKNFSPSAYKKLLSNGAVAVESVLFDRVPYSSIDNTMTESKIILTDAQNDAIAKIIAEDGANTFLLRGVTGSGKTEIYMNCISHYTRLGKSAVMLVPEISLTPQMMRLFRKRFGENVALLHSGLSAGERFDEWRRLKNGRAKIAIGARSAIFAPLTDIGIIIIDEEHDQSYISETNPRYNTQDIAKFRREKNGAKLLLGSATPSVESYLMAQKGIYELLELPARINAKPLPRVEIVSMSEEIRRGNGGCLSGRLIEELTKCIEENNQAILFVNRRGYSSFVMCKKCGFTARCADCDITLTYHSEDNILKCHYCNNKYKMLDICPECGHTIYQQGKMGTQRIVAEVKKLFPAVKLLRMDNDTTQSREAHMEILEQFANGAAQILVGTQMVVKGHDFKDVTLVGIIDADQSLHFSDYRSSERTFSLITQVAGRCGREDKEGIVILQTYAPNHYVLKQSASQDFLGFYKREINIRETTKFPPYAKIVRILSTGEDEQKTIANINTLAARVKVVADKYKDNFLYLQKMKSPIKRIQKKFRYQILMRLTGKSAEVEKIIDLLYNIVDGGKAKDILTFLEINPQNMS
jgi:primosomal protein N' (replication factor Y)